MKMQEVKRDEFRIDLKLNKLIGKYATLRIKIEYYLGGMNYFSGNIAPRGYRLSFTPCNVGKNMVESTMMSNNRKEQGGYMMIEETKRFSYPRLKQLITKFESHLDTIRQYYEEDRIGEIIDLLGYQKPKPIPVVENLSTINECKEERSPSKPYEIWIGALSKAPTWEWHVLKKYESPADEAKNPQATWLCAVYSPITKEQCQPEGYEIGDVYVKDIKENAIKK